MNKELFKCLRLYHGHSQASFADVLGIGISTVDAVESGNRPLSPYIRARLAINFELDDAFFTFRENYVKMSHDNLNTQVK